jgi:hypothetical protein
MLTRTRPLNLPKKKESKNYKIIEIPIYLGWVYIAIGDLTEIRKQFIPDEEVVVNTGIAGRCTELNSREWLISFTEKGVGDWGLAAHEGAHFVHMLFENRGVNYTLSNDEHYCYMLTWIVNEIKKAQEEIKV